MTANISLLLLLVNSNDPGWRLVLVTEIRERFSKKIWLGIGTAILLYLVFVIGNFLAQLWFDFAKSDILAVYDYRSSASSWRIGILMVLVIGPGEELFWRGFVQRRLATDLGRWPGFIITTIIYTVAHISSGNLILILAAAVCGLFWGYLYLRYRSMVLNTVSHIIWDVLIFLILPIGI